MLTVIMCRLLLIDLKQLSQIFRKHSCEIIPLKTETFNDSKLFSGEVLKWRRIIGIRGIAFVGFVLLVKAPHC